MHVCQTDLPFRRGRRKRLRTSGRSTSSVRQVNHSEYGRLAPTEPRADATSDAVGDPSGRERS